MSNSSFALNEKDEFGNIIQLIFLRRNRRRCRPTSAIAFRDDGREFGATFQPLRSSITETLPSVYHRINDEASELA
jgi:hypothetical protein